MRILSRLNISVLIKMVIKYMKVTIMSLREFLGFLIKLLILEKTPLVEPEILVSYEAWIESKSQLHFNEYLYEDDELEEYDKEDGMWQVEIYARLKADNGQYFTTEELLFKLHNLMANKELGDHVFFENLAYDDHEFDADDADDVSDDDEGTPVFVVWLGS